MNCEGTKRSVLKATWGLAFKLCFSSNSFLQIKSCRKINSMIWLRMQLLWLKQAGRGDQKYSRPVFVVPSHPLPSPQHPTPSRAPPAAPRGTKVSLKTRPSKVSGDRAGSPARLLALSPDDCPPAVLPTACLAIHSHNIQHFSKLVPGLAGFPSAYHPRAHNYQFGFRVQSNLSSITSISTYLFLKKSIRSM